jgi:hypothetical protein
MRDATESGEVPETGAGSSSQGRVPGRDGAARRRTSSRKQIYLRTVYPLNPGIPHFVDVPGSW